MTEHVTAIEQTPIYDALVRELAEPDTGDWGISKPPEFAATLIAELMGERESTRRRQSTPRIPAKNKTKKPVKAGRR